MKKITDHYKIGDDIIYVNNEWSYKENKTIRTKEKAKIVEIKNYDEENWGTLNVRIIPDRKEFWDNEGGLWIGEGDIIKKQNA